MGTFDPLAPLDILGGWFPGWALPHATLFSWTIKFIPCKGKAKPALVSTSNMLFLLKDVTTVTRKCS